MLDVLSMIPGVIWPAIPNSRASQLLALQFQLEQSQWLTPAEIQKRQFGQLQQLCIHANQRVPFYQKRFAECGVDPATADIAQNWTRLPLLSRRDIQMAGTDLHCQPAIAEHGPISTSVTSGSSGQPVTSLGTTVTRLFFSVLLMRQHLWHRRDFRLKLATIRSISDTNGETPLEVNSENWGMGTLDIVNTGPAVSLDVHASIEQQADFLLRHQPHYLLTYPSVVLALAEHFEESRLQLTSLREVRSFGEVLEPSVRAACKRVWGVPVVDSYSSQELGDIAAQCPDCEHYHVHSENMLVEVLGDDGRSCVPGETGRIVITALHNYAMPLIRYDIGDYAEVGGLCPCGRGLPVLRRIVGRQRNMFSLPDGRRVWPAIEVSPEEQKAGLPPLQQFQLVQRTIDSVELLVVTPRLLTDDEVQLLRSWVDRALGYRMDFKLTYVESIPRGRTGKYEDFRSDLVVAK